jgi:hypothetical protein
VDFLAVVAVGEWWMSNVLFTAAFLVALIGIVGIAAWVLRADRINRSGLDSIVEAEGDPHSGQ